MVWDEQDAIFPRSEQDALIPGAALSAYPATGHAPHWERPREFTRELEKFVKE